MARLTSVRGDDDETVALGQISEWPGPRSSRPAPGRGQQQYGRAEKRLAQLAAAHSVQPAMKCPEDLHCDMETRRSSVLGSVGGLAHVCLRFDLNERPIMSRAAFTVADPRLSVLYSLNCREGVSSRKLGIR